MFIFKLCLAECPAHVNKLRGTTTKNVPGWNLDNINQGSITLHNHKNCRSGNSWYGWNGGTSIKFGSISTRLSGCGVGKLDFGEFGECWGGSANSSVIVYLNGIEIGRAMSNQKSITIVFNFKEGDLLQLREGASGGFIRFNSFTVISCC